MALLVPNVELPESEDEDVLWGAVAVHLGVDVTRLGAVQRVRRSLDARHGRQRWLGVVRVEAADEEALLEAGPGVRLWTDRDDERYGLVSLDPVPVTWARPHPVVVVGAGPAGMFCALWLAEAGVSVVLLERGSPVEDRVKEVNGHWRRKLPLDPESNVVFGEGGSGTFSDGKIYTRRRDGEVGWILRRFVDMGAREDILEEGWAHLGTDKVRAVLPRFRARLRELGAEVRFRARVEGLDVADGSVRGVVLADGEVVPASAVVVAPGHSARDTVRMLVDAGADAIRRPIAVGARIEHPQAVIDRARYGDEPDPALPAASYRLAHHPKHGPKARTFCMCPGGVVVPAANQPDRVVVNGMSFSARRAYWANAAIIVEVEPEHYGGAGPTAGYDWQDEIEARAFEAGGGDETAPAQRVVDLFDGRVSGDLPRASFALGVRSADLTAVLPERIVRGMVEAIRAFDRKLPGYIHPDAVLIAPETRTTSPVRLLRDEALQSPSLRGLYPSGEGAGYGGGIVSCALDGLRVARAICETVGAAGDS